MTLKRPGVGLVWWPELDALCDPALGLVDYIEAEPETFWVPGRDGSAPVSHLSQALGHRPQPKILHIVGAPTGGVCRPPPAHLRLLAEDIAALAPDFLTTHLNVTHFRLHPDDAPVFAGFMMPAAQSRSGVELAAANVQRQREALGGARLAIETPVGYLPPAPGEWPDGDFVAAVAERADCGILLDLHNVFCNARNGRQSVEAFCASMPLDRVWEIHLAGGEWKDGYYLDAHAGLPPEAVMEATASLVAHLPNLQAITFEIMPDRVAETGLPAIADLLRRLSTVCASARRAERTAEPALRAPQGSSLPMSPQAWETLLGRALTGHPEPPGDAAMGEWWLSAARALDLYRALVGEGRANAVAAAAPLTTRHLLRTCGSAETRRLLADFWAETPPQDMVATEGRAFIHYLAKTRPALPGLAGAIESDTAMLDVACG